MALPNAPHIPWLDRATTPDMYPRQYDPYRPAQGQQPYSSVLDSGSSPDNAGQMLATTTPGSRPVVYQRATNFQLLVGTTPTPLTNSRLDVDGILFDVPSSAVNSVWLGYGNGIQVGTGIEIQPGIPLFFRATNDRQQWELQRVLEAILDVLTQQAGIQSLDPYRAPRVALNSNDWSLIASASTAISGMLFLIPEFQ